MHRTTKNNISSYSTYSQAKTAARNLGFRSSNDYRKNFKKDPRLPPHPEKKYANVGWTNWHHFLGKIIQNLYTSYNEAKAATQALYIKDTKDYQKLYNQNERLPSAPHLVFAGKGWIDWYDFLGKNKSDIYPTINEAREAARRAGVKNSIDYSARYSEDPRLPNDPRRQYKNAGWSDWYDFLGHKKSLFYATYFEAKAAAQTMNMKSVSDYKARCRQDARLPHSPNRIYAEIGWSDWYDFLGKVRSPFYATYAEAKAAAQSLRISGYEDYWLNYRKDKRLTRHPECVYADVGWKNWYDFLGNKKRDIFPTYAEAQTAAQSLRFKDRDDYRARFLEHERLPSNPNQFYKDAGWSGWQNFLGRRESPFYATYLEAQCATQALGIVSGPAYQSRHKENPKLPANPQMFYAKSGWIDWYTYLGKKKRDLYTSYADAALASQILGIKNGGDYRARYLEDPRLPANPQNFYAKTGWMGWNSFLGNKKHYYYPSYAEAQMAAKALGIKDSKQYLAHFREDARLTSNPSSLYKNIGWSNWYDFLGNKKPYFYATYAEAKAAVYAMGIISIYDYRRRSRSDPKLPTNPLKFYADQGWVDWYHFFGNEKRSFYETYIEARSAAQALRVKGQKDYQKRYREDPKLPSSPNDIYSKSGWVDWYDFLGAKKPVMISPSYPKIWADVEKWLENENNIPRKTFALKSFINEYILPQGIPDDPKYLLLRTNHFNIEAYQLIIEAQAESTRRSTHSAITAFFKWVLKEYCTEQTANECIVLPIYRSPFETVLAGYSDSLQAYRPNESTKSALGYEYILRARQFLVPNGEQALLNRPSLKDLPHLQKFFDSRFDWNNIDEALIDRSDPNCVWRHIPGVTRLVDGKRQKVDIYQIWSPVRFVANYTLLRLPLRGQQIMWLDSGEADDEIAALDLEGVNVQWKHNTGPLTGKGSKKRRPQGVIQRGDKNAPNLYITTNKTGRRDGGYEIPWVPDDLLYWFILLRDWQAKYNPLAEPTPWLSLEGHVIANNKVLRARGTQCFLLRKDSSGRPLAVQTAFENSLPALLFHIQRKGENLATQNSYLSGSRYSTPYTPHSLRVSLITAFIVDGDAPIHLISKLVGHSSLVMTIYYTKMNNAQMRHVMGETEKRTAQATSEHQCQMFRTQGLHPGRNTLIATDGNRLILENDVPNSACIVFDWGICPMSATGCHIGGELLHEWKRKKTYGAVEAGYLGQKNCLRCRFFITGVPFLTGLVALANEISLEIHVESGRFQNYSAAVVALEREYYDACQAFKPDTKQSQRKQAIANEQQSGGKLDSLLTDYAAINHYVQDCLKLIRESNQTNENIENIRLIFTGDIKDTEVMIEESRTQYHLLSEICQNATIYQSANPSRAIPLISQAIDRMVENNNLAPAMFRLTDDQKLIAITELNTLLLERLGSWERIEDLFSGELMLLDIDAHEPKLTRISDEVQNLLFKSANYPLNHELKCHE